MNTLKEVLRAYAVEAKAETQNSTPTPCQPLHLDITEDPEYLEILEKRKQQRFARSGLAGIYRDADSTAGHKAYSTYKQGKGTYFYGQTGRGKTYAAATAARLVIESGQEAYFTSVKSLLDQIKATYDGEKTDAAKRAETADLLVLDDFGVERATDWSIETLTALIDNRIYQQKCIIFTSNYALEVLAKRWQGIAGERLFSRIQGACVRVCIQGKDRRQDWIAAKTAPYKTERPQQPQKSNTGQVHQ